MARMWHTAQFAPAGSGGGVATHEKQRVPVDEDVAERESELDEALDDTFPASDAPAPTQPHSDKWLPNGHDADTDKQPPPEGR